MTNSIVSILEDPKHPQTDYLEPSLLSVFRLGIGLELILLLLGLVGTFFERNVRPAWVFGMGALWLTVLLLYLSWPKLHKRLGRWFLPPALIFSGIMPLLDRVNLLRTTESNSVIPPFYDPITDIGWRVLVFVLLPITLTAWQYGMPQVLLFATSITAANSVLNGWAFGWITPTAISTIPLIIGQGAMLVLVGYVVVRIITAQREQRARLAEANAKLADYAATVDRLATSRERNRLARELHDTLSHTLSSLAVQLEATESVWRDAPEQAHTLLIKSIANTRGGLAETRRALQALRASPLEDLGLGLALRNLAELTAKRAGLILAEEIPKQIEGLSPQAEQCIYRVAQESLENVVRHACAQQIRVALGQRADRQWVLTVADDGQGFDPAGVTDEGHYGLQGMRERAVVVGGQLEIESQPGAGTQVRLVI